MRTPPEMPLARRKAARPLRMALAHERLPGAALWNAVCAAMREPAELLALQQGRQTPERLVAMVLEMDREAMAHEGLDAAPLSPAMVDAIILEADAEVRATLPAVHVSAKLLPKGQRSHKRQKALAVRVQDEAEELLGQRVTVMVHPSDALVRGGFKVFRATAEQKDKLERMLGMLVFLSERVGQ